MAARIMARMLTADDVKILDFERAWSGRVGAKRAAIRAALGLSAARYYQRLDEIVATRDALESDPVLVHRVIRLRDELSDARAQRTFRKAS